MAKAPTADSMIEETDDSAVNPRDIQLHFNETEGDETNRERNKLYEKDPAGKALLDLKELFEKKISVKITGSRRDYYD